MGIKRPEDGAMKFKDDWPGIYIRGDSSSYYAKIIDDFVIKYKSLKEDINFTDILELNLLENISKLLKKSNMNSKEYNFNEIQQMKIFDDCLKD